MGGWILYIQQRNKCHFGSESVIQPTSQPSNSLIHVRSHARAIA
jgi:hypothetical protein